MAFVADFNEEELQRALAAAGGAPTVSEGPGGGLAGSAAPAGPAVPAAGGPPAAGGEGTGFVNLSRYFDANDQGANASAQALIDPLKVDLAQVGQQAHDAVPMPDAPATVIPNWDKTPGRESVTNSPSGPPVDPGTSKSSHGGYAPSGRGGRGTSAKKDTTKQMGEDAAKAAAAAQNAANQAAYGQATVEAQLTADQAQTQAMQDAAVNSLQAGRNYIEDPNKLAAGMAKGGQTPSQFDAYLTGAAMPNAYAGLAAYYGADGSNMGRSGQGGGRQAYPAPAAPVGAGPESAPAAMDPAQRKKSKNIGGW